MNKLTLNDKTITYEITYKKNRKTIGLKIVSPTLLQVVAPLRYPKNNIENIIISKSCWILKQICRIEQLISCPINKSLTNDSLLLFLGEPYLLVWTSLSKKEKVEINHQEKKLYLSLSVESEIQKQIEAHIILNKWLIMEAKNILHRKTLYWSQKMKCTPRKITLKDHKSRWGSCSSLGNINYNWRIVMAPPTVIDYLVIHELTHLKIPNHSKDFWSEVESFSPNYKECRNWLKTNGSLLIDLLFKSP